MIIGLTGRVGSGKTAASGFIQKQCPVEIIDLDQIGHLVLNEPLIRSEIEQRFGKQTLSNQKKIDRHILGDLVFEAREKIEQLNAIVHPRIKKIAKNRIQNSASPIILVEGALIQEIGLSNLINKMIVIDVEDSLLLQHIGTKKRILNLQRTREDYLNSADVVIQNDYSAKFEKKIIQAFFSLLHFQTHLSED